MSKCPECGGALGGHFVSCPTVAEWRANRATALATAMKEPEAPDAGCQHFVTYGEPLSPEWGPCMRPVVPGSDACAYHQPGSRGTQR